MSRNSTAEGVHQEYVGTMGIELGDLYFRLWNECVLLHWKWGEYVSLFGTSAERVTLLNQSAGAFFWIVQDTLWADVLLHISRLTDPPKSAGKDNLTLRRLPALVDIALVSEVDRLLQECVNKCSFARDWRMRHIAHRDLELALEHSTALPLAAASRKSVKAALEAIAAVLNCVELHYRQSTVVYELHPLGNAESLLYVLQDGIEAESDRLKRLKTGTFIPEDLRREPI